MAAGFPWLAGSADLSLERWQAVRTRADETHPAWVRTRALEVHQRVARHLSEPDAAGAVWVSAKEACDIARSQFGVELSPSWVTKHGDKGAFRFRQQSGQRRDVEVGDFLRVVYELWVKTRADGASDEQAGERIEAARAAKRQQLPG